MRLKSLDSLRGIAALVVVFHHCLLTLPGTPPAWLIYTPLHLLVAGPAAVLIFFVLSGLVLAITFVERDGDAYAPFLIKRLFRIWPAFAVAIIASAVLEIACGRGPVPGTSGWFAYNWSEPLSAIMLANHLLMTGAPATLDNPMWSLIAEIRNSLVFPLLVAATLWNWRVAGALAVAVMLVSVKAMAVLNPIGWRALAAMTPAYLFLFVAGIALAERLRPLRHRVASAGAPAHVALWVIALALLLTTPVRTDVIYGFKSGLALLSSGIGATMIVLLCASEGQVFQALTGPIPIHLGRVSYSLTSSTSS